LTGAILALIGLATGLATFLGGGLALALKGRTRVLFGISAGAVLGVAVLDLAPEALRSASSPAAQVALIAWLAAGFVLYLLLDLALAAIGGGRLGHRAHVGPASLTIHSLFDGLAIGLAFRASTAIGAVVALVVIAHDLADGANTVALSLGGGSGMRAARRWLLADALAPLMGIALARMTPVPHSVVPYLLAVLAGGLGNVGLTALVGASRRPRDRWTLLAPLLGFAFMSVVGWLMPSGGP
jgi:ZIP family zinc transporter